MVSEQNKEVLRKHYKLFTMVNDHDYLPGGYHNEVQELNRVYKEIHGVYKDLNCGTCVRALFHELYIPFEGQDGSTLFVKEDIVIEDDSI